MAQKYRNCCTLEKQYSNSSMAHTPIYSRVLDGAVVVILAVIVILPVTALYLLGRLVRSTMLQRPGRSLLNLLCQTRESYT